jgi:ABC-type bacteriocin/lantibiotic exporter with double-glycine peptidase domain
VSFRGSLAENTLHFLNKHKTKNEFERIFVLETKEKTPKTRRKKKEKHFFFSLFDGFFGLIFKIFIKNLTFLAALLFSLPCC